jgi:hypothetical protein
MANFLIGNGYLLKKNIMSQNRLNILNERLEMVTTFLTNEQAKETPDATRVSNLTERKNRLQSKIDRFSEL